MKAWGQWLLISTLLFNTTAYSQNQPRTSSSGQQVVSLTMSRDVEYLMGGQILTQGETTEFDCGDQIYATVLLPRQSKGEHQVIWRWYDPSQNRVNQSTHGWQSVGWADSGAQLKAGGHRAIYLTRRIHFQNAKGTAMLHVFDPAFGYEAYIGQWRVEVWLDQRRIAEQTFSVLC